MYVLRVVVVLYPRAHSGRVSSYPFLHSYQCPPKPARSAPKNSLCFIASYTCNPAPTYKILSCLLSRMVWGNGSINLSLLFRGDLIVECAASPTLHLTRVCVGECAWVYMVRCECVQREYGVTRGALDLLRELCHLFLPLQDRHTKLLQKKTHLDNERFRSKPVSESEERTFSLSTPRVPGHSFSKPMKTVASSSPAHCKACAAAMRSFVPWRHRNSVSTNARRRSTPYERDAC